MNKYTGNFTGSLTESRKQNKEFYYNGVYCKNGFNSMKRTADKTCVCFDCSTDRLETINNKDVTFASSI